MRAELSGHGVTLKQVRFSYTGEVEGEVLHGVDLDIPQGSFTALVGPSGGGKSTVAKLISRFWDVTEGTITIGGVDVRKMPLSQLADTVSFVTQDNFLFRCSLKENIRLGNPKASDEEVAAGGPGRPVRGVHRQASTRLRHPGGGGGQAAVRRREAANRYRPDDFEKRSGSDFG